MPNALQGDRGQPRGVRLLLGQLGGSWALGSALMGTVAVIYLRGTSAVAYPLLGVGSVPSPVALSALARLGIFLLVVALFVLLGVLGSRTSQACWLAGDSRSKVLWALLVGGGGLLGWSFAAVVTFAVHWGGGLQITLAYTAGGLPFALVAAMLARPWQLNAAAVTAADAAGSRPWPGSRPAPESH
jgi:hypothetical protein